MSPAPWLCAGGHLNKQKNVLETQRGANAQKDKLKTSINKLIWNAFSISDKKQLICFYYFYLLALFSIFMNIYHF